MTSPSVVDLESPNRPNPFDKELYMDERYFEPSIVEAVSGNPETIISQSSSPAENGNNTATNGIQDWELGISPPGGASRMGLTRAEELILAIESCKEMILQCSEENKEKRRKLVEKLVQLRFQFQEIKEGPIEAPPSEKIRVVTGHEFILQERTGRNPYCEQCQNVIWRLVQPWYRCKVCGYRSHDKCMDLVRRVCSGVQVRNNPNYIMKICPERGLAAQKYRCFECKAKLAFGKMKEQEPRLCDYTGMFFCHLCHWNDQLTIPARVVQNWDFEPRMVSRSAKQFLEIMQKKPVLRLDRLNPALFNYVEELRLIRKIRQDIMLMKCYFICCKKSRKLRILWHLKKRQHFVEGPDAYSIQDLLDLINGTLEHELRGTFDIFIQHIKRDCESCRGNGFLCELCPNKDVIFPFDDYISICKECQAVFHRRCFDKNGKECTRCERRKLRQLSISQMPDLTPETSDASPERSPTKNTAQKLPFDINTAQKLESERKTARKDESPGKSSKNAIEIRNSTVKTAERKSTVIEAVKHEAAKVEGGKKSAKNPFMETNEGNSRKKPVGEQNKPVSSNPFEEEIYDRGLNPFGSDSEKFDGYDKKMNPFE